MSNSNYISPDGHYQWNGEQWVPRTGPQETNKHISLQGLLLGLFAVMAVVGFGLIGLYNATGQIGF